MTWARHLLVPGPGHVRRDGSRRARSGIIRRGPLFPDLGSSPASRPGLAWPSLLPISGRRSTDQQPLLLAPAIGVPAEQGGRPGNFSPGLPFRSAVADELGVDRLDIGDNQLQGPEPSWAPPRQTGPVRGRRVHPGRSCKCFPSCPGPRSVGPAPAQAASDGETSDRQDKITVVATAFYSF